MSLLPSLGNGRSGMRAVSFSKRFFAHRIVMVPKDFLFNISILARYTSVRIAYP
jgi:hypothetical protein